MLESDYGKNNLPSGTPHSVCNNILRGKRNTEKCVWRRICKETNSN